MTLNNTTQCIPTAQPNDGALALISPGDEPQPVANDNKPLPPILIESLCCEHEDHQAKVAEWLVRVGAISDDADLLAGLANRATNAKTHICPAAACPMCAVLRTIKLACGGTGLARGFCDQHPRYQLGFRTLKGPLVSVSDLDLSCGALLKAFRKLADKFHYAIAGYFGLIEIEPLEVGPHVQQPMRARLYIHASMVERPKTRRTDFSEKELADAWATVMADPEPLDVTLWDAEHLLEVFKFAQKKDLEALHWWDSWNNIHYIAELAAAANGLRLWTAGGVLSLHS